MIFNDKKLPAVGGNIVGVGSSLAECKPPELTSHG